MVKQGDHRKASLIFHIPKTKATILVKKDMEWFKKKKKKHDSEDAIS